MTNTTFWQGIGYGGQAIFAARFVLQWAASERKRTIVIPQAFWWFSILGGVTLLIFAIHERQPVFVVGQAGGLVIYARNLFLMAKRRRRINMCKRPREATAHAMSPAKKATGRRHTRVTATHDQHADHHSRG
jgi:lipid-A-disaccharide synthase-like uncharacterized protein